MGYVGKWRPLVLTMMRSGRLRTLCDDEVRLLFLLLLKWRSRRREVRMLRRRNTTYLLLRCLGILNISRVVLVEMLIRLCIM